MPESDQILSSQEVAALLSVLDTGKGEVSTPPEASAAAVPYDFKRPERVSREQLRALEALHDSFARNFQAALSGLLRAVADVRVARIEQISFQEFVNSLPNPTVFVVFTADPSWGSFAMVIHPSVAFPILERLLGSGKVSAEHPHRPLTRIEWRLMETVVGRALEIFREAWEPAAPAAFTIAGRESNPQLAQLYGANEAVVVATLEVTVSEHRGAMNLCLPVAAVERHLDPSASWIPRGPVEEKEDRADEALSRQLAPAEVRLSAHLAAATIRLRDLEEILPGDLLVTRQPASGPVQVSVEGRPKFEAQGGRFRDRRAARILGRIDPAHAPAAGAYGNPATVLKGAGLAPKPEGPSPAARAVIRLPLSAAAVLAEKTLRLQETRSLCAGTVVKFDRRVDAPVELRVAGRALAEGQAVKVGDRFGLRITAVGRERAAASAPEPQGFLQPPA